jgi:sulfur carrier protein ThiS
VWGVGRIQAPSNDGVAICGGKTVSIVPSYDTHADLKAPLPFQTEEFATAYNNEILRLLRLQGIRCSFELVE